MKQEPVHVAATRRRPHVLGAAVVGLATLVAVAVAPSAEAGRPGDAVRRAAERLQPLVVDGDGYAPASALESQGVQWTGRDGARLVGVQRNTLGETRLASQVEPGTPLYRVSGEVGRWDLATAAYFATRGYTSYVPIVSARGAEHPNKVLWIRRTALSRFVLDATGQQPRVVTPGVDEDFAPNWFVPYRPGNLSAQAAGLRAAEIAGFTHGIRVSLGGEEYYFDGPADGQGGEKDIPGHYWIQTGARDLVGLHFNTGPFDAPKWWSSDAADGDLLYVVRARIDTWSDVKAAYYAADGYQHYHELVSVQGGEEHPNLVVWLKHYGVRDFLLDGGPMPAFSHRVFRTVDRDFVPNWFNAYGDSDDSLASFERGITLTLDGVDYVLAGAPDSPSGRTDIPGHGWVKVGQDRIVGVHYNTGPFGASSWWSSDAGDGALLYYVIGFVDEWTPAKAAQWMSAGYQHHHELLTADGGEEHQTRVLYLRHIAVGDFILDGGPAPQFSHNVFPGLDYDFVPNWFAPYAEAGMMPTGFSHGITVGLDGEAYYLDGAPDGPGGAYDIPGHYWRWVGDSRYVGLHYNTGPFGTPSWWSSDADDGALLYVVHGVIDTWSDAKAAFYASRGFQHYHELVTVAGHEEHETLVLWLNHTAVRSFTLDGGPMPEFAHAVTPGLDRDFVPNWFNPYGNASEEFGSFVHGIALAIGGETYYLDGAPDGPGGVTDIPGHSWVQVGPRRLIGLHENTGPSGAADWWSSDAGNGALLYVVEAILDTWTEDKAAYYGSKGFIHYHEVAREGDGMHHPSMVLWLRHVAVSSFTLDGGPAPAFAHAVTPGLDTQFVPNGMTPYAP